MKIIKQILYVIACFAILGPCAFANLSLETGIECNLQSSQMCLDIERALPQSVFESIKLVKSEREQGNCFWFSLAFLGIRDFTRPEQMKIYDEEKLLDMGLYRVSQPVRGAIVLFVEYGRKMRVYDAGGRQERFWQEFREPYHMAFVVDDGNAVIDKQGPRSSDFRIKSLRQLTKEVNDWSKHKIEVQYYISHDWHKWQF